MKVVVNKCHGGFGLSIDAILRLYELAPKLVTAIPVSEYFGIEASGEAQASFAVFKNYCAGRKYLVPADAYSPDGAHVLCPIDIDRSSIFLVQVVEEMGVEANGPYAELAVLEIPDGTDYQISEHSGIEHIAETHRTWS